MRQRLALSIGALVSGTALHLSCPPPDPLAAAAARFACLSGPAGPAFAHAEAACCAGMVLFAAGALGLVSGLFVPARRLAKSRSR